MEDRLEGDLVEGCDRMVKSSFVIVIVYTTIYIAPSVASYF